MTTRYLFTSILAATAYITTAQVPTLLRDINPNEGSNTAEIKCFNGLVYFRADDGVSGLEPWVSDGTTDGTVMLKDINPGDASSFPISFLGYNGRVFFAANNGVDGYTLWSTDGTGPGTQMELDVDNVQDLVYSSRFTVYNDMVVFTGQTDAMGSELWRTDGTVAGTSLIMEIHPGTIGSSPRGFTEYNGLLYFGASTPDEDEELWVTDGTAAGTHLVMDIDEGTGSGAPRDLAVANGLLFFKGDDGYAHGAELWATDGTTAGTYMVKDILPGGNGSLPQNLVAFNNEVWFTAYNGTTTDLWHSDGTEAGTVILELPPDLFGAPDDLAVQGGDIYFTAFINGSDQQLWKTDGTAAGTAQIVYPGSTVNGPLYPAYVITSCGDFIFFAANYDVAVGAEPYTLFSPVGIAETQRKNELLHPNPATDRLYMADAPPNGKLQLYSANGQLAVECPVRNMHIGAVPTGLYLARIIAHDGTVLHVQRVVKE